MARTSSQQLPLVLAVDDDPVLSAHVMSSLKRNYRVASASSAQAALDFLESNKADLIVLDVLMPEVDGLELYKKLRKNDATKDIPVLFLTGAERNETLESIIKTGEDYIAKPILPNELLQHVRKHIKPAAEDRKRKAAPKKA